jgi:hypothetical protein
MNKKMLWSLVFSLACANPVVQAQPVTTSGLIGAWEFNGNANDSSAKGNNGTVQGASLTNDKNGNANSAYNFNGNSYISISDPNNDLTFDVKNQSFTIAMQVKLDNFSNPQVFFMDRGLQLNSPSSYSIGYRNGVLFADSWDGGTNILGTTQTLVNSNQWYDLVVTSNTVGWHMYLDGISDQRSDNSIIGGDPSTFPSNYNSTKNNEQLRTIGANYPGPNTFSNATIDNIYVYNRVLSANEISTLYNSVDEPNSTFLVGVGLFAYMMRRKKVRPA